MLIIDTLGYKRFKITPDPIELEKNPDLKTLIFEAEPYIISRGDQIKLEFHLFQNMDNPVVPPEPIRTGGMGSQDNIGTPGIINSLESEIIDSSDTMDSEDLEMFHHHKTIFKYELSYLDIQLNGFKDWLGIDECILKLYEELKPINPDNYLISEILKKLSCFIKQDSVETRIFTPEIKISSEYKDHFDFIYNKALGVCHKFQNHVSVFIEIEATLNILVQDPTYQPADIIRIGDIPYYASNIIGQTFATKPFVGYTPTANISLHSVIEPGANYIQIVTSTNNAPGIREARWGLNVNAERIKFIINMDYVID